MALTYHAGKDSTTQRWGIFTRDAGREHHMPFPGQVQAPVALLASVDQGFPLDSQALAQTVADILNHRKPVPLSSGGREIFYSRNDQAIVMRLRPPGEDGGVSAPSLIMTVSPDPAGRTLMEAMDPDFMKQVCDAIQSAQELPPPTRAGGPSAKTF